MKKRKDGHVESELTLNRIAPSTNVIFNIIFLLFVIFCVVPVVFVFIISISSETSIKMNGYRFWPEQFSLDAYKFLFEEVKVIFRALRVSIAVTVIGGTLGVFLTTLMGYVLSIKSYKFKGFFTMVVFIPMIFNGGMLSSYVINTQVLGLSNTIWALILPLTISSFNIIICKTFFQINIPSSIAESAQIDGASHFTIYRKIILPLSKPIIATIALFLTFGYWNDWFQASLYITDQRLYSMQALLDQIQRNLEMMANNPAMGVTLQQHMRNMPRDSVRMAMAMVIIVPIACTYPFFQKYFISGLTIGAVKE